MALIRVQINNQGEIFSTTSLISGQIEYGNNGKISSVGDLRFDYGNSGKISSIGNIIFDYGNSGKITSIGNARIEYGNSGKITYIGNDPRVEIIII